MNKLLLILFSIIGLSACNNSDQDQDSIKAEINTYRVEIVELENKIHTLEKLLSDSNATATEGRILVGTQTIVHEPFTHYLDVTGNVEAVTEAFISPEINGLIKSVNVKDGDYVTTGHIIAIIETDITQNTINEVKTQLALAQTVYDKQKELWDQKIGSEIQYLQAKANKESIEKKLITLDTQLKMATIRAPFDGVVETVFQKNGEIGSPGRQLIHLVNIKNLLVTADLSESYLPSIHPGDMATIKFSTFPDLLLSEPIKVIGSVINPNNRTIKIQIPIDNKTNELIPNVIANIRLIDQHIDSAFVIPSIVVKNDALGNSYIYLISEENDVLFAKKQYIKTGKSYGNQTMVIEGLKKNDQLIVGGYNLVKNGSKLRTK